METMNKQVAVAPFKKDTEERQRVKGLDLTDVTVTKLIETEVLFDSERFKKGDILYFRADVMRLPQATQKLQLGDVTFILMHEELPVFHKRPRKNKTADGRPEALPLSSNGQ